MADNTATRTPQVSKPETPLARSEHDPDRKDTFSDTKTPKTSGAPVRDVREDPAPSPNGNPKGQSSPQQSTEP